MSARIEERTATETLEELGAAAARCGRWEEALEWFSKAVQLDPGNARHHNNTGCALQELGRMEEAVAAYGEALRLAPGYADALSNLGGVLTDKGQAADAVPNLLRALAIAPGHAVARSHLVLAYAACGNAAEAEQHARQVVASAPGSVEGLSSCVRVLLATKLWRDAIPFLERWARLKPMDGSVLARWADCLAKLGENQDAVKLYRRAFDVEPSASAANNVGACEAENGNWGEAWTWYRHAVELDPHNADAWTNLGIVMRHLGRPEIALRCFQGALACDADHAAARWNRALCLLSAGALEEGWAEYEWGWKTGARRPMRPYPLPRWDGSGVVGKRVLVSMEQGLGDQILFASMLPDLLQGGAQLIVECERRLVSLFARSFPSAEILPMVDPASELKADFHTPAGSLARWLRPTVAAFPQHTGYLKPEPALLERWKARLGALGPDRKVGICWRSQRHQGAQSYYSTTLHEWGAILTCPNVQFVNLQYDECEDDLRAANGAFGCIIRTWDDLDLRNDQEGVAALISNLDLVISVSTAVHEMAGAVGTPAWVLTRGSLDVWGLGTNYCPWFPSVRAFSCGHFEPWEPLLTRIAKELRGR